MDRSGLRNSEIQFQTDEGENVSFFVLEETRISGVPYLLVADSDGDGANAFILKDLSEDGESEARYVTVEDDVEFDAVAGIFAQMMEDTTFVKNE